MKPKVKARRTNYTELEAMNRHREYGYDVPCTDIDCIEYDYGTPVAMIEYKHFRAQPVDLESMHPTTRTKLVMANAVEIPFFIVRYWPKTWTYKITPVNDIAKNITNKSRLVSEQKYVKMLYWLRNKKMPGHLDLNTTIDPTAKTHKGKQEPKYKTSI